MTGKFTRLRQVNRLKVSRGHDGIWRARSPFPPHEVLFSGPDHDTVFRWAHRCRKFAKKEPIWTAEDLEWLNENYGRIPAEVIAKRLKRSKNALKIITYRKLGINQRSNMYTARSIAEDLGVS